MDTAGLWGNGMMVAYRTASRLSTFASPGGTSYAVALLAMILTTCARAQKPRPVGSAVGTWAFKYSDDRAILKPLLDLRHLNEKKAGQSGFVRVTQDG
jgi:hypothetical protein